MFAGDSWAIRAFTEQNYNRLGNTCYPGDVRLADYWDIDYDFCFAGGQGNLVVLDKLITKEISPDVPIVWVYTEPGRDYGRITKKPEFEWITKEDIFNIRQELDVIILKEIRKQLPNPIGLIGGLSDVNTEVAESLGLTVLYSSWQRWIAETLNRTKHFEFGWGAADIGWRMHSHDILPGRAATFAYDKLIKEWCMWEELGYMCHEHPTPRANQEFAEYLKKTIIEWYNEQK